MISRDWWKWLWKQWNFSCLTFYLPKQMNWKFRPNISLHSSFDFWKAKIRCPILYSSNIFLVLLHSFDSNTNKSDDPVFCHFFPPDFCYLHLLFFVFHIVCKLPCSVSVQSLDLQLFRFLFLQNTSGDGLDWLHQSLLSSEYFWLIYGQTV